MIKAWNALFISAIIFYLPCAGVFASPPEKVIRINNAGVIQLRKRNFEQAIKLLTEAFEMAPDYDMARKNLAIAYNNWGLADQKEPQKALPRFQMAILFDSSNFTALQNFLGIIIYMNRKPDNFKDHVELAELAIQNNNLIGGYVGYSAALSIDDNSEIKEKQEALVDKIVNSARYSDSEKSLLNSKVLSDCFRRVMSKTHFKESADVNLEEEQAIEDQAKVLKLVR